MELGYCTHGRKPIGMIVKSICFIKQCPVTLYNCAKGVVTMSAKWLQSLSRYLKWNFPLPDCVLIFFLRLCLFVCTRLHLYLFVCESAIMLSMTLYLHVLFCVLYMSVRLSEGGCIAT